MTTSLWISYFEKWHRTFTTWVASLWTKSHLINQTKLSLFFAKIIILLVNFSIWGILRKTRRNSNVQYHVDIYYACLLFIKSLTYHICLPIHVFFYIAPKFFLTPGVADETIGLTWVTATKQFRNTVLGACFGTWQEQAKTTKTCFQIFR
jgi:hypothetical protein